MAAQQTQRVRMTALKCGSLARGPCVRGDGRVSLAAGTADEESLRAGQINKVGELADACGRLLTDTAFMYANTIFLTSGK